MKIPVIFFIFDVISRQLLVTADNSYDNENQPRKLKLFTLFAFNV